MQNPLPARPSLALPDYLFARRDALLHIWRTACKLDTSLHIGVNLSREEFNDQIPTVLNLFEQQLRGEDQEFDLALTASEHGLHRWHKGYSLRELLAELSHFNQCLAAEITEYKTLYSETDDAVMTKAYELVVKFSSKLSSGSVVQYDELQRNQAAERAEVLRQTLDHITEMTRQRGEFLRMTSHDLRSGLGVIQGAASLLSQPSNTDQEKTSRLQMLRRNLLTVEAMLSELTSLARLEAGQETVSIQTIDVSALLRSIVESTQPMAAERGLTLRADGPSELIVETDSIMIQRIVQNLLMNALKHTHSGLISVSWSSEDNYRWVISVQDTGTGLPDDFATSLTKPLKPTLDSPSVFVKLPPDENKILQPAAPRAVRASSASEGIGLYIVKSLCQLLNASIDIETQTNRGTLFRIRLPSHPDIDKA
ncbi:HAMP domain-containing histidine kinase [Spirosoma taeanense]|uniref:histidine kinase n=1 Tax=Spirosoma taeanense TaxID=2735870 RepID=A0A6M5Y766_9BACT|nr:HAMP domain-containing sensor histidine kinase [Spirosoma taeanense]QJW89061.1 HAMP domain-containing histidine kinase [Spirosoma taeanense]